MAEAQTNPNNRSSRAASLRRQAAAGPRRGGTGHQGWPSMGCRGVVRNSEATARIASQVLLSLTSGHYKAEVSDPLVSPLGWQEPQRSPHLHGLPTSGPHCGTRASTSSAWPASFPPCTPSCSPPLHGEAGQQGQGLRLLPHSQQGECRLTPGTACQRQKGNQGRDADSTTRAGLGVRQGPLWQHLGTMLPGTGSRPTALSDRNLSRDCDPPRAPLSTASLQDPPSAPGRLIKPHRASAGALTHGG